MRNTLILMAFFLCGSFIMRAQADSVFRIRTTISGSVQLTRYSVEPTPQSTSRSFPGSAFVGRVLWLPDHLLAVGLQSGYMLFSREQLSAPEDLGIGQVEAALGAIPIQLALTMSPAPFEIGVGIGVYYLQSLWKVKGENQLTSSDFEYGVSGWIGYELALSQRLAIGPELSFHALSNRGIVSVAGGVRVRFDAYRY